MNLLYIATGKNIDIHSQAHFSIFSFLTQRQQISSINIVTDSSEYYADIQNYINIIKVDEKLLNEWKGEHQFFWRIKIKAIELVCRQYPNSPVVYLDTDTFLYSDITNFKNSLERGTATMHEDEGALSAMKAKTSKVMWRQIKGSSFGGIDINNSEKMWNAGVVGTPNTKDCYECDLALQICDEMCAAGVTPRLIEQFALSVALNSVYGILPTDEFIGHYWSNKKDWNNVISNWLLSTHFQQKNTEELIEEMKMFDFSALPVKKINSNTGERLSIRINKVFKPKIINYINKPESKR